ncbi:MAG TPA: hypothetical protein VFJ04_02070 [Rhodanobacteraceae bacterium]|nr:hypothetical protein [Rhodanobacteraceae bacterium]
MTYLFYAIAAAMIAVALLLVLRPLLQRGRRDGRSRGIFGLALGVAFVLPLAAIGLYALVGTPVALDPAVRNTPPQLTIQQAVAALQARLQQSPDDVQGWMLLGQTYDVMQQPVQSRDAYGHALKLAPDNVDVMVAWAQADSLARDDHAIAGQARALLQKAVAAQPRNQRALWLLGISDYQAGHFADAALTWRRLQVLLKPGSKVADAVLGQIAMANARASGKTQAEAEAMLQPATADATAPRLRVDVSVAPALAGKVAAGDSVFVFARADGGSPMPLAVTRLDAAKLPATVILTDGMGMTPSMNLSSADKVVITARVSKSGQALPQPGDLEGSSPALDVHTHMPVAIVIDHTR